MRRHVNLDTGEMIRVTTMSRQARRAMRLGSSAKVAGRKRAARRGSRSAGVPGAAGPGATGGQAARPLAEWHDLSPGELITEWAGLRAWVTWLSDRYELSVEERLPRCWALHPGLVEELWALKAWREEIYTSGMAGLGQAARYWHSELRQVIQAASSMYAAGCRTGHRGAAALAGIDADVLAEWDGGYPLAGVPEIDVLAGRARGGDGWASAGDVAAALDDGHAVPVPGVAACVHWGGAIWEAASGGWVQVPGFGSGGGVAGKPGVDEDGGPWSR